jgi:hypothetical protein
MPRLKSRGAPSSQPTNSRAVGSLLEIMTNNDAPIGHRLEAAELLLTFEAPAEVVEQTKLFLAAVFENEAFSIDEKLLALRLTRKAEAPRVAQQTIRAANTDKDRELWRDLEIAARRMKLDKAGLWGAHPKSWADDLLTDDYTPPPPGTEISDLFED